MKKIFLFLLFLVVIFSFSSKGIYANTGNEIIKRFDSDISISNTLLDKLKSETNSDLKLQILLSEIPNLISHYNESSLIYLNLINSENDEESANLLRRLSATTKSLSDNFLTIRSAIQSDDEYRYNVALKTWGILISEINTEMNDVNAKFASSYDWLPWAFWITLVTSLILFLISRGNPVLPAEILRNQFEFALFKSSLWPFGGALISYGWQLMTPPGETYYVLTWLIGIGYIQFARGLYSYIKYSRPAIETAKKEEQGKLEKLISSNKFNKESLKEKAKNIEKLSPVITLGADTCSSCGTKNSSDTKYCKECGKKIN
jgi:hypothetical protein